MADRSWHFLQFWPNLIILTKIHNFQQNHISQNWYFCQIWYLCQIITFSIVDIFINRFWYFYQHLIFISIIDIFINCLLKYQLFVPVNCNFKITLYWNRRDGFWYFYQLLIKMSISQQHEFDQKINCFWSKYQIWKLWKFQNIFWEKY